jgi:AbrB family looped-hinge helix DNA binding protein
MVRTKYGTDKISDWVKQRIVLGIFDLLLRRTPVKLIVVSMNHMTGRKGGSYMSEAARAGKMNIYGTVKVGERGQVVIPSKAREDFNIKPGDLLLVFAGRRRGVVGLVKADEMKEFATRILKGIETGEHE